MDIYMKKKYTKKQIQEAIKYWQKQLKKGNYRTLCENSINDFKYCYTFEEFIEYDDEPGDYNTIAKVVKNLPIAIPSIKVFTDKRNTIHICSNNLNDIKKAVIYLSFADGEKEYNTLIANNELDQELDSLDFKAYLNIK